MRSMLSRRMRASASIAAALLAVAAVDDDDLPDLVRVRTAHFDLFTDVGAGAARSIAVDLEEAYAVKWRLFFRTSRDPDVRAFVLLLRQDDVWAEMRPGYDGESRTELRGFHDADDALPYVAASLSVTRAAALRTAHHEISHLLIDQLLPFRPFWLSEGLAEYLATLERHDGRVVLGKVPEDRTAILARQILLPLDELVSKGRDEGHALDPRQADFFYAESWSLVHYLLHGADDAQRRGFEAWLRDLRHGEGAGLEELLGVPLAEVRDDLRFYVKKGLYRFREVPLEEPEAAVDAAPERLSEADSRAVIAFALTRSGSMELARLRLPERFEVDLGFLARARLQLDAGAPAAALATLDAGLARHPDHPLLLVERARLRGRGRAASGDDARADQEAMARDLDLAMQHGPWLAAAVHERARVALAAGGPERALGLVRRAIAMRGGEALYYHTLAEGLARTGNLRGALDVEARALPLARSPRLRDRMEEHVREIRETLESRPSSDTPRTDAAEPPGELAPVVETP